MRPVRRSFLLPMLALAGGFAACDQIFGIVPGMAGAGGQGGTSSTASSSSTSGSGGLLEGCVLLLHMDEPSWTGDAGPITGAAIDSSGQGNNGTPMGTANTTANGKFGRAGNFDGSGWVQVPNAPILDPATPISALTYAAWVYPTGLPGNAPGSGWGIIAKRTGYEDENAYTIFLFGNMNAYADIQGGTEGDNEQMLFRFSGPTVFSNNAWYHVAVVYDGANAAGPTVTLYVNGTPSTPTTPPPPPSTITPSDADVYIANLPNGGSLFVGMIDEVAVWNRALSPQEIQTLYTATSEL